MVEKIGKSARCGVIGHGSWATAIVKILCENETNVNWYVRNPGVVESLLTDGCNPRYLRDAEFDISKLTISRDINEVVAASDIIVLAMPSAYTKDFLADLTEPLADKFILSAIKGIVPDDYLTIVEYMHDHYDLSFKQLGIISGPTHAEEVSLERLSYLTVVCSDLENARIIGSKFETKYIKLSYSTDIYGVEYSAILKNIYAIAVGIASGLGYGDNFLAVLISNSALESARFLNESYPAERNTRESVYLGDLLVTCYSMFSRNRRFGLLIGNGCSVKSAFNEMTMVVEGYFAAESVRHTNIKHKVDMPIADMVYEILYKGASPKKAMKALTSKLL